MRMSKTAIALAVVFAAMMGFCLAAIAQPANQPPVANAGPNQTLEQTSHAGAVVTLDGSASTDADGDTLTFTWAEGATVLAGPSTNSTAQATLPLGVHTITLTVDDGHGATDSATVTITIQDTTPPAIQSVSANPNSLWPANHKMVKVTFSAAVTDICDASPTWAILSVSSNEPVLGTGDGNTSPDWEILDATTVNLRAERSGKGSGRIYTITIQATDISGNTALATTTVAVAHDQGKNKNGNNGNGQNNNGNNGNNGNGNNKGKNGKGKK